MKVLVIKTESVIPRKILLEAQKEIEKCAASGILLLDGGYTYEVVDIDMQVLDILVNPDVEKEPDPNADVKCCNNCKYFGSHGPASPCPQCVTLYNDKVCKGPSNWEPKED